MIKNLQKVVYKNLNSVLRRNLVLHEYQVADILQKYNLPIINGFSAKTSQEVLQKANQIKQMKPNEEVDFVVKAQIHAGGRGKGHFKDSGLQGGVHIVHSEREACHISEKMLGKHLITKQTGHDGKLVSSVYVVERVFLRREMYLAILLDRSNNKITIIASAKGGVNIEEMDSDVLGKFQIDPVEGLQDETCKQIVKQLQLNEDNNAETMNIVKGLYKSFIENDSTLLEINPLGLTIDHKVVICDSKMKVDENSAFRQTHLFDLEDLSQKDWKEVIAKQHDLNYVALEGNIGCMVNGAGLAMATMDLIKMKNGLPANFLDIGGRAKGNQVVEAMKIINDDDNVEALLVNIFAGIARCDEIALGIIKGVAELGLKKPIVMRMKGTNFDKAKALLKDCGFNIFLTDNLEEAAEKVVKMASILKMAREAKINVTLTS